jgi:hypothetical protein
MEIAKIRVGRWVNLMVKCGISCVVIWFLILSLDLMRLWYPVHPVSRKGGVEPPVSGGKKNMPDGAARNSAVFWPQYFGSARSFVQQGSINGVQMIGQTWETTAPAKDVIAYYREQMTARGWQDVTEETYKFQPESRYAGIGKNSLQDQQYLRKYSETMDSDLVLRRGDWSIQVTTIRNEGKLAQTGVRIFSAATPSIEDFVATLTSDFASGSDSTQGGRPLEMEQESGGQHYHTTIASQNVTPFQAFREALANLGSQGWQSVMMLPPQKAQGGYFAWLGKGKQYAMLFVKSENDKRGASVMFTEVAPK